MDSYSPDKFVLDPGYRAYQEELRHLIFNTAHTAAPTRQASPSGEAPEHQVRDRDGTFGDAAAAAATLLSSGYTDVDADADVYAQTGRILSTGRRLEYLKNYVAEVAPWLDMFDSNGTFTVQVPLLARSCPALLCAILALSARQMERKEGKQHSFDSLDLYQQAIRHLNPLLQQQQQQHQQHEGEDNPGPNMVVPVCVVLCCLEMMSASPRDWRRHLEGCATLFDALAVHGFTGDLLQPVFWCYARMDLCSALISDGTQSTLVPPRQFLPRDIMDGAGDHQGPRDSEDREDHILCLAADLFAAHRSPDMHANYAVYLASLVCELLADRTRFVELADPAARPCDSAIYERRWLRLWHLLQDWVRDRPADMEPLHVTTTTNTTSASAAGPFPHVLFSHWAAISSTQLYHTACILLLASPPRPHYHHTVLRQQASPGLPFTSGAAVDVPTSTIWHAKRICGISLTNPHQGCLNNAIQPLWIAGRLLSHKSEHLLLVKLIRSIEAMTGWATSWRIADLEASWGYKVDAG